MHRVAQAAGEVRDTVVHAAIFLAIGVAIALGRLLDSEEKKTPRIVIGRCLSTGGLSVAAGMVLVWVPDLPLLGQMGVAAALASLGTSGLERVFQRAIKGRTG